MARNFERCGDDVSRLSRRRSPARYDADLSLAVKPTAATPVRLEVHDSAGTLVRTLTNIPREIGVNTTSWNLAFDAPRIRRAVSADDPDVAFFGAPSGPRVLPGRYRITLVVGDQRIEQPLQVRIDPTVNVTAAALAEQFTLSLQLRDLQSLVNDTLRALDGRKAELEARKRAAEAIPDSGGRTVVQRLSTELAVVDTLLDALVKPSIAPFWSEGPRIADRVGNLLRNLQALNAQPTGPQRALSTELATELRIALDAVARKLSRLGIAM